MYVSSSVPSFISSFPLQFIVTFNLFLDLLLFAALLLEFAAQSSKGIDKHISQTQEELFPIRLFFFILLFITYDKLKLFSSI